MATARGKVKLIGVIGNSECDEPVKRIARQTGGAIARAGYGLVCGGMGGVMEAACRGATEAGGLTVGILPSSDRSDANPAVDIVIPTGLGIARNILVVYASLGVIAIHGQFGTLSEIAYALQVDVPVVGINTWDVSPRIATAPSAEEAVRLVIQLIESGR